MNEPAFQQTQRQFLNYLRQPQTASIPAGFAPERLAVYAKLLYNKFDESLSACFPVIHAILSQADWQTLLMDFIAKHRCASPYYRQIPDEFLQYLQQERRSADDLPFLVELAHFEWVEMQLSIAEADPITIKPLSAALLLANVPVFAPVMQLLHYQWPVQDINPAFLPTGPLTEPSSILAFRAANDSVQFIALNPMTARLIVLLQKGSTGQQAMEVLGESLDDATFATFLSFGIETLTELHQVGAIIDVHPSSGDYV